MHRIDNDYEGMQLSAAVALSVAAAARGVQRATMHAIDADDAQR
jgi:hypothetical protein